MGPRGLAPEGEKGQAGTGVVLPASLSKSRQMNIGLCQTGELGRGCYRVDLREAGGFPGGR